MSEELSGNEYRQQRIENMNKLEEAGFPAFGKAFERITYFSIMKGFLNNHERPTLYLSMVFFCARISS